MKYTKFIIFFFTVLFCAQESKAAFGKYPIQNFSPADYKAGNQNIAFAQNRDMSLFVANNLGVLSYDGIHWENHAFKSGKKTRSLAFDENTNRLYVGSQGEFGYFSEDWKYTSLVDSIPKDAQDFDEVWDVFIKNAHVYFCTFQGIYIYNRETITVIDQDQDFLHSFLVSGNLYTQSGNGELFEIDGDKLVSRSPKIKTNQEIREIIPHKDGHLLFYNSGMVEFITPFGTQENFTKLVDALQGKYVNHVLQLSDSRLVISTQTSGVFIYDLIQRSLENISTLEGLKTNACLNAFQDYSGNLWIGTQNGISLIDISSPMRLINEEIKIEGSGYDAYEAEDGTYYSTSSGIYFKANNATASKFLSGTEGPAYSIQEILGKIYAGHHTGLFQLNKDSAKRIVKTIGLWQVKQLKSNPDYAVGGTYLGLYLFKVAKNLPLQPVGKIDGFNESSRFFEEDHKGNIWVGQFYKGLFQLTLSEDLMMAEAKRIVGSSDVPIDDQIILSRIDNELFLGTNDGVFKMVDTGEIVRAEIFKEDIGRQPVYLLSQDKKKNIHIITEERAGLYKQISQQNYVFVPSSLFQIRYSINNDLLNLAVNINDGVLFSANEGFIKYSPQLETQFPVGEQLVISNLYSVTHDRLLYSGSPFEKRTDKLPNLTIKAGAKVLQFSVEAFQFDKFNSQQFRYFLKGFDADYGEWSTASTKEYTNLREGNYEFYAQSRNYLGEINNSLPLAFKVKPPFYRTNFAKLLYLALVLLLSLLVSRLQKTKYKRKVELQKEESTQKIFAIEQEKEQVLIKLEEQKVQNELRHVNNQLAASTMNLVVKNEFIETIKEELTEVDRKGKNAETKRAIQRIVKEIDTTLRLQEDWVQFEHHFDKVHGDFLTRLRDTYKDLTPNEQKLCALLRLNLSTKEISNMMSISHRGVEIARYRLRKKLNLIKGQNLSKFILEY